MRIENVIGYWLVEGRKSLDLTQAEVGERMGQYLGKSWARQSVSAAEKGERSFTAAELIAFALVLQCPVESLLRPPASVQTVELGEGMGIPPSQLYGDAQTDQDLAQLLYSIDAVRQEHQRLQSASVAGHEHLQQSLRELKRSATNVFTDRPGNEVFELGPEGTS